MSALVLGKRSTSCLFEELHHHPAAPSPSASKRPRSGASPQTSFCPPQSSISTSPTGLNRSRCASNDQTLLVHLRSLFPHIPEQLLEKVLEASGNDLDYAIVNLKDFYLESPEGSLQSAGHLGNTSRTRIFENPSDINNIPEEGPEWFPADGSEWVELLVREMSNATNIDAARLRTSRLLEALEKSIMNRASAEVVQTFHKENLTLKEQVKELLHDNNILKRAVAIQHERQKEFEFDERNKEIQHLKQLVAQHQEHLRTLEVSNYALSVHLRQAQEGTFIPGRSRPDTL